MNNFADRLIEAIDKKKNPSIIGLDTDFSKLPEILRKEIENKDDPLKDCAKKVLEFNKEIVKSIKDIVPAVKIQSAFYEQLGPDGEIAFLKTAKYAKEKGLIVVGDVKRNDIGNTSKAYSNAYLGKVDCSENGTIAYDLDSITVNPYLGSDGITPFIEDCKSFGKGIFVLAKTSNPSSKEIQDLACNGKKVYEHVGTLVDSWGKELVGKNEFSSVGAVVGATYPDEAKKLRKIMPRAIFLVPGYGAQGGDASDIVPCFNTIGYGALIHSARSVIYAYQKSGKEEDYANSSKEAAIKMSEDISSSMKRKGIYPW